MGKNIKYLTLDEWIESINTSNNGLVANSSEFFTKYSKKSFNDLIYRNTFNRLSNIILKLFKWTVPKSFSPRAMELGLLNAAWLCCFKTTDGLTLCLPGSPSNKYNVNYDPTQFSVYGYNGYHTFVNVIQDFESPNPVNSGNLTPTENEGVVMRDNDMAYPYIYYIREYSLKLADKIIALNVATQRLKSPFTYTVDEKELKDTVEGLVDKIESNDDVIIRLKNNKTGDPNARDPVQLTPNTMRPEIIQAIKDSILFDFDMFLETIGINTNPTPDKSQYVNDQEIGSNNGLIQLSQDIRFLNRKKFCEDAKKLGVEMSVEVNVKEVEKEINKFKKEVEGDKNDKSNK